ncbi:MAG TPA: hypothetical protein EYQ73_05655 [Candidatus Poseidoniales archaeon]|jgi:hypothetical protein|nr:hypothetical protein [Candidatus Poseidoniales archaeon]
MTTFGNVEPYEAPATFEEWLDKRGISQKYAPVFNWSKTELHSEYNALFKDIEESNNSIKILDEEFQNIHETRLEYMEKHGIKQWHELNPAQDSGHLLMKETLFDQIKTTTIELKLLREERRIRGNALPLVVGIILGSYPNYSSIISDEEMTHGMMSTNGSDPMWKLIGPIHNLFWSMYPKLNV